MVSTNSRAESRLERVEDHAHCAAHCDDVVIGPHAGHLDGARIRSREADDGPHRGGLPGAVRADEAIAGSVRNGQGQVVECDLFTETFGQRSDSEWWSGTLRGGRGKFHRLSLPHNGAAHSALRSVTNNATSSTFADERSIDESARRFSS
jgi:hypothetical protein